MAGLGGFTRAPSYPAMGALQQRQTGGFTGRGEGGRPPLTRQNAPAAPTTNAPMGLPPSMPPGPPGIPPAPRGLPPGGEMRPPVGPPMMPPGMPPSGPPGMSNAGSGLNDPGANSMLFNMLPQGTEQFFGATPPGPRRRPPLGGGY